MMIIRPCSAHAAGSTVTDKNNNITFRQRDYSTQLCPELKRRSRCSRQVGRHMLCIIRTHGTTVTPEAMVATNCLSLTESLIGTDRLHQTIFLSWSATTGLAGTGVFHDVAGWHRPLFNPAMVRCTGGEECIDYKWQFQTQAQTCHLST